MGKRRRLPLGGLGARPNCGSPENSVAQPNNVAQPPSAVALAPHFPAGGGGAARKGNGIRGISGTEACRAQAKQMAQEVIASEEFQGLIDSAFRNPHSAIREIRG